jgi:DNA-binding NarL/FixJ family response regulator
MNLGRHFLIADDHPLYREAAAIQIRRTFPDADIEQASSWDELKDSAQRRHPDLMLVDYHMPGMSSQNLADLVSEYPQVPVAVISGMARNAEVRAVIQAGVRGYIPKTSGPDYFAHALQMLVAGGSCIPGDILADEPAEPGEDWLSKISERELQVLKAVTSGQSNKEIGRALGIAEITVKLYLRNVFRKMDVKNRSEAAVKAVKAGLG